MTGSVVSSGVSTTTRTSQCKVTASRSRSSTGTMLVPSLYAGITTVTLGWAAVGSGVMAEDVPHVGYRLVGSDQAVLRVRRRHDQHVGLVEHLLEWHEVRVDGDVGVGHEDPP